MIQFDYSDERRLELAKKAAREDAQTEERESNAINLFKNGVAFDVIKNSIPSIKESRLKELQLQAGVSK